MSFRGTDMACIVLVREIFEALICHVRYDGKSKDMVDL